MKSRCRLLGVALLVLASGAVSPLPACAEGLSVTNGQKIAFLGDSITQQGAANGSGYVWLTVSGLAANDVKVQAIPAGISGHKSTDMLARLEKDVLSKRPDWMTLSCGVNDVWHQDFGKGVMLEDYKQNIAKIVDLCQAAGIKVMILTSTMIGEDQPNAKNQKLIAYNDVLRALAKEKNCLLADLNADMQAELVKRGRDLTKPGTALTTDGVHMNLEGNQMMARGVLKAFGLGPDAISKVQDTWADLPATCELVVRTKVSIRQFNQLKALAEQKKQPLDVLLSEELKKPVDALLNAGK
jgi:lysophospholipase L1-like esterase